jgi:hypothetical protein
MFFSNAGFFVILLSRRPSAKALYMQDGPVSNRTAKVEKPVSAVSNPKPRYIICYSYFLCLPFPLEVTPFVLRTDLPIVIVMVLAQTVPGLSY